MDREIEDSCNWKFWSCTDDILGSPVRHLEARLLTLQCTVCLSVMHAVDNTLLFELESRLVLLTNPVIYDMAYY